MLNQDIRSRFADWLLNPAESLDFEVKQWLPLTDAEAQGAIAKALIALENHGGGFLLVGFKENDEKTLVEDHCRPLDLSQYTADSLNAIIKRRAEPAFHVEVTFQSHPATGLEYPLIRVSGASAVPIRSDSSTPKGTLKNYTYYIRAPGPESRAPLNASEWDALLRRSAMKQRDEIIALLRNFMGYSDIFSPHNATNENTSAVLDNFVRSALDEWSRLNNSLEQDEPGRIKDGHFYFAARIIGIKKNLVARDILSRIETGRRYTGWPIFLVLRRDDLGPMNVDGMIQAWVAKNSMADPGHADFWRVDPDGLFFSLRGYQEDSAREFASLQNLPGNISGSSGQRFEVTLPVWRLGEFILKVDELADQMFEPQYSIQIGCHWSGLKGRRLYAHNFSFNVPNYISSRESVDTAGSFSHDEVANLLPEVVRKLTAPLYEAFEFFSPEQSFYGQQISRLTGREM